MGRPLRRVLVAVLAGAVVVLGVAIVGVVVVTTTPFGARQALRFGADRIPGELAVGEVEGSLYSGLELSDVRYRNETVDARFESLSVEPSVSDLTSGRIVLNRVSAGNGRIEIGADGTSPADNAASDAQLSSADASLLPQLPASLDVRDLRIAEVQIEGLGTPLRIETVTGSISDGSIELDQVVIEGAGATLVASGEAMLAAQRATGALSGTLRLPAQASDEDAPAESIAFATEFAFDESADARAWQASVDWSRLEWRRPNSASLASPSGGLVVRPRGDGTFDVSLRASVEGEPLPAPSSLTASAAVSAGGVDLERARLGLAGAEAVATGAFHFDAQSGYLSLDYRGIDPSRFDAPMSGDLHGALDLAIAAEPVLRIGGSGRIDGELGGRPIDGRLVASYADEALSIERADVALDDGRVVVAGMLSPDTADLRFSANVPRIGNWYPPVTGSLTAAGSIAGDTDDPRVELDVEGANLVLDAAPAPPLEHVELSIGGTRAAHTLRLDAASDLGRVAMEAEQHYADGGVNGRLLVSVLEPRDAGVWRLAEPAAYAVSANEMALEQACYAGPEDARLCTALAGETLTVTARAVPNGLAEPWLPERFEVAGTTSADAEVALAGERVASVALRHDDLRVGVESEGDVVPLLDLDDVLLRASLDPEALEIELNAAGAATGSEAGTGTEPGTETEPGAETATAPDTEAVAAAGDEPSLLGDEPSLLVPTALAGRLTLSPPAADGRLDGFVSARLTELGLIGTLIDDIGDLSGIVDARLALSGTVESPSFSGRVSASELAAEIPPLGIDVAEGRFSVEVAELESIPFEAELCSEGCARLAGRLSLPDEGDWALTSNVRGEEVLLVDLPDLRAVTTPRLEVRVTPQRATVAGTLAIPVGSIEVEDVPRSAVRPAPETVVHGRDTPEDDEEALPVPLAIDVEASLGDVRFEGLGLEAQLDGTLDVERTVGGDWIVQGTTTIEEGTFGAFGQTLMIEQGLLVFTGPPKNPTLDIRATRVVDEAEVGIEITGTAENPRSEVFSEEGLAESEAFAQLLTGRSLNDLGESDPEALERAAIGLGLRRALPTLGRIGAALGLDELGVQAPGDAEGAVVAGRQIGNDVYLRYRHGLFDDFSGLELIYRITEHFRLRTETGTAQSIDLIYEVDPDPDTLAEDIEEIDVAIGDPGERPPQQLGPDVDAE